MTTALAGIAPGVYPDLDEQAYHRDLSASSTVLKALLKKPAARVDWERRHPPARKRAFDLGTACHTLVLGRGAELVPINADSYRTKAAQQAKDAAWDAGLIPLLPHEVKQVHAMADSIRTHPEAGPWIEAWGDPELSVFWVDEATGVPCRARFDKAVRTRHGLVLVDVKTTMDASDLAISKAVATFGYHQQEAHYRAGAIAAGLHPDPAFVFVFVEKEPPYLVSVAQLDGAAVEVGRRRNERALRMFADYTSTGVWPGYDPAVSEIGLPHWALREDTY